jgi:hypothetical protein
MFISFLFELLRDYFIYKQSYDYCDMNILRKYTEARDTITNNNIKLGTGKSIFKKELSKDLMSENINYDGIERVYKSLSEFYAKKYVNYDRNNKLLLNIPKIFNNNIYKDFINKLEDNKYETISLDKSNDPECLIDLKCFINSRNVINYQDLIIKTMKFNNYINKKLKIKL